MRVSIGRTFLGAFAAGVANLERHVDEINALNVYPVPDGDTGSNMVATVRAALDEATRREPASVGDVATALSYGALMGARGNSGVITSQLLRGIAEAAVDRDRLSGLDLAYAFAEATRAAYGAVAVPVEGTILTVARDASAAAVEAAERGADVGGVLEAAVTAAADSVRRTPTLLAILAEAGVVDAGGQGLYRLLEGAAGHDPTAPERPERDFGGLDGAHEGLQTLGPTVGPGEERHFGYETLFLVEAGPGRTLDIAAIRRGLEELGESVLVAGDERRAKVHVHGERPDAVIGYGLALGTLSNITVENLDAQAAEVREARHAAFVDELGDGEVVGVGSDASDPAGADAAATGRPAVVAVVPGEGLARVFRALGVELVVGGGQAANPSTGELLRVARLARTRDVIVLPNNPNVRMAAEQAAAVATDRRIVVIPSRNPAEGLAALLALDPDLDAVANAEAMTGAARGIATLQVTEAVRDAAIDGRSIRRGETIVLDPDDGIVAGGPDRVAAIADALATLPRDVELVTLYAGEDADTTETAALVERVRAVRPDAEVEVIEGGQPHYRYLISAE